MAICIWFLRYGGVDHLDVTDEIGGDRVCQGADGRYTALLVREGRELGVEELIRLCDGDGELEQVTSRSGLLGSNIVRREPRIHGISRLLRGSHKILDLQKNLSL